METEDEPPQKRPHLDNNDSSMARQSSYSPPPGDNEPVDAAVLQYQNQKLVQQLEAQKQGLHGLESKIKDLKEKQSSYDEILIKVNQHWNQLMKLLEDAIDSQRAKFEDIAQILLGKPSAEDAVIQLRKLDDLITEEASCLQVVVDVLHSKHKQYADTIHTCINNHSVDQLEIKRLAGELEESTVELEESRRKLVNLRMQKDGVSGMRVPIPVPVIVPTENGTVSPEKAADRSKHLGELKESIEEIKVLAEDRLSELRDARGDNSILSKQLEHLQNDLKEEKYVHASRPYSVLNDQFQHWNTEAERYKTLTESLQLLSKLDDDFKDFLRKQWDGHGDKQNVFNQEDYFHNACALHRHFNFHVMLNKVAGRILRDGVRKFDRKWSRAEAKSLLRELKEELNGRTPLLYCLPDKEGQLYLFEVHLFFNSRLELLDAPPRQHYKGGFGDLDSIAY